METSRRRLQEKDLQAVAYYFGTPLSSQISPQDSRTHTHSKLACCPDWGTKPQPSPPQPLTSAGTGLACNYHLRSNSGSNGLVAKECHRFLVAGPFKLANKISPQRRSRSIVSERRRPEILTGRKSSSTTHSLTFLATDSGASTSISTAPSL